MSRLGLLAAGAVALAWPAAWLCWGPARQLPRSAPRVSLPRVTFVRQATGAAALPWSPMLIALPSSAGAETAGSDRPHAAWLASDLGIGTQPIPYRPEPAPPIASAAPQAFPAERVPPRPEARPLPPAFPSGRAPAGVTVDVADALRAAGFEAAAIPADASAGEGGQATVVARVEGDAAGGVAHVFLESPCQSAALNLSVIRALKQGRMRPDAGPVSGSVSVTFRGAEAGRATSE